MNIFITGTAGFIGSFLAEALAKQGHQIYGIDSINDYYDINLKKARLKKGGIHNPSYNQEITSSTLPNYRFRQIDLCDNEQLENIFQNNHFDCIINLAAQAGVRYSLQNPQAYIHSNIEGFINLLECCRLHQCSHFIYASSSSVYGNSSHTPFNETERVDQPISLYAATKKSNELMAYTYSHLYGIQTIGLRFFTVYGPYGRPDMAPILFANAIKNKQPIRIFNNGNLSRDFTYIDDIIEGIIKITEHPEQASQNTTDAPAVVYNIGHGSPTPLMEFIHTLEKYLNQEAQKEFIEMQPGDVYQTWADTRKLKQDFKYTPSTPLEEGIKQFTEWHKNFYK
ncbi:NAD-dependent epimerase/dehydratase family protein [Odoribacter lunatus]|uniref:NAD-dependent epimerase/dehydratase family protein n=1 Tax=Odoribacter lunatus TaxID=2941335 RepID=UPI00203E99B4|nr:NAD-dependent epimerase/dehydratase family protein [Odoribacter lunatus]